MTSRDPEGQGRDPDTFEPQYLKIRSLSCLDMILELQWSVTDRQTDIANTAFCIASYADAL